MTKKHSYVLTTLLFAGFLCIFSVWRILKTDDELSVSERRKLSEFPELNAGSVISGKFMDEFEDYAVDQFPMRDGFRRLKAATSFYALRQKDTNGIYIIDGQASRLEYPINHDSINNAVSKIKWIYDNYLAGSDTNAYFCLVPDKNCYLAEKGGYLHIDYDEFSDLVTKPVSEFAEIIDIYDLLGSDDYFATDIHWREEKIVDVAQRLADRMGAQFHGEFEEHIVNTDFWGVFYGQSALPLEADSISYLTSPGIESASAFDYESNSQIPVYSMELANGKDPYEMYLCGSRSLITIENPNALNDRELIIFRDSFGSSIAPLLIDSYKKITLVDIRYLQSSFVGNFVSFADQDVLFLYSIPVINNSVTMK